MSGGHFEYNDFHINEIINSIEEKLQKQGQEKLIDEYCLFGDDLKSYLEKYPEEKFYYTYPKEVQEKLQDAINTLKAAAIYTRRVDNFLSGDDGEETFLEKLSEELDVEQVSNSAYKWKPFNFEDESTRPTKYGKYFICRKDGKVHWETWNGSGWAYNHNEIRYWAEIVQPTPENINK